MSSLIISRRLGCILCKSRLLSSLINPSFRVLSTEAHEKHHDISNNNNNNNNHLDSSTISHSWSKVYPFSPSRPIDSSNSVLEFDRSTLTFKSYPMSRESREEFIKQQLVKELNLERTKVNRLYHLVGDSIEQNYPANESILQLCELLKMFFTPDDLYHNPKPFMLSYNDLFNRIMTLKELGFRTITSSLIGSIPEHLQMTPKSLSQYYNYFADQRCFNSLCKALDIKGSDKENLLKQLQATSSDIDDIKLFDLRNRCILHHLSSLLEVSVDKLETKIARHAKKMQHMSLFTFKHNINFLMNQLNYSVDKILRNDLFVRIHPDNLQRIFLYLRPAVGYVIFEKIIKDPKFLAMPYEQILENFCLIRDKNDGKFFSRALNLLAMPTDKLQAKITAIETNEDIQKLGIVPALGMDYVLLKYDRILDRIDQLKTNDIPITYVPLTYFISEFGQMGDLILEDLVTNPELRIQFFIENVLQLDYSKVRHAIRVIPQVSGQHYSKKNTKQILEFLISKNIPKASIIEAIYLILFDYKQVKLAYQSAIKCNDSNIFQHMFDYLLSETTTTTTPDEVE